MTATKLTFAELSFLCTLLTDSELNVPARLGLDEDHVEVVEASGLASLVARNLCMVGDDQIELQPEVAQIVDALAAATRSYRVTVAGQTGLAVWQIFDATTARQLITPLGHGVFECVEMRFDEALLDQVVDLVEVVVDDSIEIFVLERFESDTPVGLTLDRAGSGWVGRDPSAANADSRPLADLLTALVR